MRLPRLLRGHVGRPRNPYPTLSPAALAWLTPSQPEGTLTRSSVIQKDFILKGKNANVDTDYGPMTPAAEERLQSGLDEFDKQFVTVVAEGRRRKYDEMRPWPRGVFGSASMLRREASWMNWRSRYRVGSRRTRRRALATRTKSGSAAYPPKRTLLEQLLKSSSESASL